MRLIEWLLSDDTGTSSKTIVHVMENVKSFDRPDIPYDAGDFGRCYRLLEAFPRYRKYLYKVADEYPEWLPLVNNWDYLESLYQEKNYERLNRWMRSFIFGKN